MAEQQWEYCELWLQGCEWKEKANGWISECFIFYCGPTGQTTLRDVAVAENIVPYNPFRKAMGLLGGVGWELVSEQVGQNDLGGLYGNKRVAFFKRPIIAGRAVDEPELIMDAK